MLRVDLWDWDRGHAYAVYTPFHLENEKNNYKIRVGQYSGTAGNAFDASKLHSHKGEKCCGVGKVSIVFASDKRALGPMANYKEFRREISISM